MRLFDTATGEVRPLEVGREVRMYTCGITPYDATHLGHLTTFSAFDVLQRRLIDRGHEVRCVRNVTDVDDSLLARAAERGMHYLDLAAEGLARFDADLAALGFLPPSSEPRATSAIPDIRRLVGQLIDRGRAYVAEGHVYLDAASCPGFAAMAGDDHDELRRLGIEAGERVTSPGRRGDCDTVLWQPSGPDEPEWDSRWGPGRPGWHVECAALALRELGAPVDLHGGGRDLLHPHHTYEAAQAEAVTDGPFVRHWMHVGLVTRGGVKMAKSVGNLVFAHDLLGRWSPGAIRVAIHEHHYREGWEWEDEAPARATERLERWSRGRRDRPELLEAVRAALDDDLDVPAALDALDDGAARGADPGPALSLLGVVRPGP